MIAMYRDTFPPFVPMPDDCVSERSQKQFYDFMKNTYDLLFEHPTLLFSKTHDDDAHRYRFNKSADNKPELAINMRRIAKKVEDFLNTLYSIGKAGRLDKNRLVIDGNMKMNKNHLAALTKLGIAYDKEEAHSTFSHAEFDELFHAWKWLADAPNSSLLRFSRCQFNPEYSYPKDIFKRLSGNEHAFQRLIDFLEENGYTRIDNRDNQISLDYVKNYDTKEMPVKDAWAERTHGGISVKYDSFVWEPVSLCLRVPKTKQLFAAFDEMSGELKSFVVKFTKNCDGCRYCVQTDKTGTRKLSFVPVVHDKEYRLCPLFPGFSYCWTLLDEHLTTCILDYLSFIDKQLEPQKL